MTDSLGNIESQSKEAELVSIHMAQFLMRHPLVKVASIHDSLLFATLEDAKLYFTEWESFLKERGISGTKE